MCGRFTMTRRDKTELAAMLGVPEGEPATARRVSISRRPSTTSFPKPSTKVAK
jgi:hypothetical protein